MHFEVKDTELEIVTRVALEDELSLDGALKKLLFLGRDIKRNEDIDLQVRTQALESILERLELVSVFTEEFYSELRAAASDVKEIL